jgi:uncharacterized protein (TIGR03435 family)
VWTARFDVQATLPDAIVSVPVEQRRLLLRRLLIERFDLKTHVETRQVPVYALKVAREGALGPDLRASQLDCDRWQASRIAGVDFVDRSSPPSRAGEPTDANGQSWCTRTAEFQQGSITRRYAGGIGSIIRLIQSSADRLIVDQTGLEGSFEWTLTYLPATFEQVFRGSTSPGLFTAIREQLGLVLDARTAPAEVRIVDSVSMPEPN